MVLDLIIDDNGGNALVETKRGKLYRDPPETIENEEQNTGSDGQQSEESGERDETELDDDEVDALDS